MKCEICGKQATEHLTEIKSGKHIEKHLCEQCLAQSEGGTAAKPYVPLDKLLTNFVQSHQQGLSKQTETLACPQCGITWAEFRQSGLLGCEHDYPAFEKEMTSLLQRAHEGAAHHVGKVPTRRGGSGVPVKRTLDAAKLRKELARAVETEDYEKAAKLRDQIRQAEG
jgi:protein arginine kinase activator